MIVLCVGRRHQGKTTLGYSIARRCDSRVILDVRHAIPSADPVGDLPDDEARLYRQIEAPEWPEIVVRPGEHFERTNEYLARSMTGLMRDPDGRIAILLDEAGLIDFGPWDPFFRTAHPERVILIVTAHRLQDIPPKVRALADWFCLFRTTEPNDIKLVRDQCGERVAAIVPTLAPRVFVQYDAGATSDDRQIVTYADPSAWFVAMGQPQFTGGSLTMPGGTSVPVRPRDLLS
jgi:hypothetical protein